MSRPVVIALQHLALLAAMLVASRGSEANPSAVSQALIWLPTGVAIAGLWLLGLRAIWVVALATYLGRCSLGYSASVYLPAIGGSCAEAIFGVVLLRRFGVRGDFANLREVLCLSAAATLAPLGSILFSFLGRSLPGAFRDMPFYSGWDGWWRMNALGALTVVPVALLWLGPARRRDPRLYLETALASLLTVATVLAVALGMAPGVSSILLLSTVLPVALLAAVWQGVHGATVTTAVAAVIITTFADQGIGPFQIVAFDERHVAVQIFTVVLVAVPLVFGALIEERDGNSARWLRSEGLRRALLRVLPDVVYRLGPDDTFRDIMVPEGSEMPVPAEQLLGRHLQQVSNGEHAERLLAQVANARAGLRTEPVEYPMPGPDGVHQREVRFVPLDGGEVLGVVRDVTYRRLAEQQVAWQTAVLERIASGRPHAEVLNVIVHGIEKFLGARASLLVVRGEVLRLACAPSLPADYNRLVDGLEIGPGRGCCGTAAYENAVVVSGDILTDPRWQAFHAAAERHSLRACWSVPVHSANGAVLGTFAVYHDRRHEPSPAELALVQRAAILTGLAIEREQREGLLASIQANVSEGLFRTTPSEGLVYVNPACATMFGYATPDEMLRRCAQPEGNAEHRRSLRALGDAEQTMRTQEHRLHRCDGSPFWALVSSTVVRDADGAVTSCDGAIADITVPKHLEEQLRQSQKMEAVGQLAGGVAHDFNNLLTAISGYAESVRDGLPGADPLRHDAGEIVRAASRAADLTRQLLAFGRRQVLSPKVIGLREAVDEMATMLQRVLGERIVMTTQHAQAPAAARVDRGQLEQVVLNLALNARDAMPDGGRLTIGTDLVTLPTTATILPDELPPGRYAVLWVADDGSGMEPAVRERAFEPFFTTKAPGQGTGLGLSTVYGTVKQSGGCVRIDSTPGKGTTVWVYLPLVAPEVRREAIVEVPRPTAAGAAILVAEDEPLVRELVHRALTRAGHTVVQATNGEDALALAMQRPFDVVVTDVVMPRLGGRELATRLAVTHPCMPLLYMSGYASEGERLMAAASGPAAILNKPFTATQLLHAVAALLAQAKARAGAAPTESKT